MPTLIHLDEFWYGCKCGNLVNIGRKFTEDEQEWTVCSNKCASELLDMALDPQSPRITISSFKEIKIPKLGRPC